jgi:hypothetical protein
MKLSSALCDIIYYMYHTIFTLGFTWKYKYAASILISITLKLLHTILLHCVQEGETSLKNVLLIIANYTIALPLTGGKGNKFPLPKV